MSAGEGRWHEGRRAWERLAGWYREGGAPPPDDADPLAALSDIGLVRRLLDEAELEAVRAARRHGRSWAEIAVKLGVTRQSAWERWRDLDTEPAGSAGEAGGDVPAAAETRLGVLDRAARLARRRASVTVPKVVGLPFADARSLLAAQGLVGVPPDLDGPPPAGLAEQGAVVTDQSPEAGAKVPPGSLVKLWTERGGGSGVREPRRPRPTPPQGRKFLDEPSEEAVG